jgi:peptidoglycan/LPS O-acetylase OafA/YrhL
VVDDADYPRFREPEAIRMKVAVVAVVLAVAAWLAWLGWDQQRSPDETGPYDAWQVVGLALTLAVLAAVSSWWSADLAQAMVVVILMAAALTVSFSIDAATEKTPDANLWPVGAILLFAGTMLGLWAVAGLTRAGWQWTHRAKPR